MSEERDDLRSAGALISHIKQEDTLRFCTLECLEIFTLHRRSAFDLQEWYLFGGECFVNFLHQVRELDENQDSFLRRDALAVDKQVNTS